MNKWIKKRNNEKINKEILKIFLIIVFILIIIGIISYVKAKTNYIYLTQFSPSTARQMMGYAIKTINDKIIIIDGGTTGDVEQLKKYIQENRK